MELKNRKVIYSELETVLEDYCKDCFLYSTLRKEKGRNCAHKFCISQCTVGQKIRTIGSQLTDLPRS
ncbi:zinc-finger domain-containing protein [Peribacillus glennii]|uniref:Zinc-finger domain-containing protein n=1 Tax=Peribacillus glennii TaxID=2303991 RepID=A0A372LHD0_9BACI|nr:zinc-finger domain-containing protein [Peribacillus glennii]RFU65479.1 zinc-finger domain-containing protein [Peribacillus glennii]